MLDVVTAGYPCRAIVLRHTEDLKHQGLRRGTPAAAFAIFPLPGSHRSAASESSCAQGPHAVDLLPGAVRPVARGGTAVRALVDRATRGSTKPLFRDLADECSRLILDLPDPAGLDPRGGPGSDSIRQLPAHGRDSAWFGLTRWRELVAQFFDPPCHHETLNRVDSLRIEALSPDPSRPPRTGDLAGGLALRAARLEAAREARQRVRPPPAARSGPRFSARWVPSAWRS